MKSFISLFILVIELGLTVPSGYAANAPRPVVTVGINTGKSAIVTDPALWKYGAGIWHTPTSLDLVENQINKLNQPGIFRASIAWEVLAASKNINDLKIKLRDYPLNGFLQDIYAKGGKIIICIDAMPHWLARDDSGQVLADGPAWAKSPPKILSAWSDVVEEVVRHFNNDLKLNAYYEIWNEPDWAWQGSTDEYFALYKASAEGALKADLKTQLGGPALSDWMAFTQDQKSYFIDRFFTYISTTPLPQFKLSRLPLSFLSWHSFYRDPESIAPSVQVIKKWLSKAQLTNKVSLFIDEWNVASAPPYPEGDLNASHVGAAFVASTLLSMQTAGVNGQVFQMVTDPGSDGYSAGTFGVSGLPRSNWMTFKLLDMASGQQYPTLASHKWVRARISENANSYFVFITSFVPTERMMMAALFEGMVTSDPESLFSLRQLDKNLLVNYVTSGKNLPGGLSTKLRAQLSTLRQSWLQYVAEKQSWQQGIDIQLSIPNLKSAKSATLFTIDDSHGINPTTLGEAEQAIKAELGITLQRVSGQIQNAGISDDLQQRFLDDLVHGMMLKQETIGLAAENLAILRDGLKDVYTSYDAAYNRQLAKIPAEPAAETFVLPATIQTIKLQFKVPAVQLLVINKNP